MSFVLLSRGCTLFKDLVGLIRNQHVGCSLVLEPAGGDGDCFSVSLVSILKSSEKKEEQLNVIKGQV